jgi:hypothetical protein
MNPNSRVSDENANVAFLKNRRLIIGLLKRSSHQMSTANSRTVTIPPPMIFTEPHANPSGLLMVRIINANAVPERNAPGQS